jgi:hypothetical protein
MTCPICQNPSLCCPAKTHTAKTPAPDVLDKQEHSMKQHATASDIRCRTAQPHTARPLYMLLTLSTNRSHPRTCQEPAKTGRVPPDCKETYQQATCCYSIDWSKLVKCTTPVHPKLTLLHVASATCPALWCKSAHSLCVLYWHSLPLLGSKSTCTHKQQVRHIQHMYVHCPNIRQHH